MSRKKKKIPAFRTSTAGERARFPNLKPSLRTISLRLPESMLAELKLLANKKDVPYPSPLKVYLAQRIREEIAGAAK